jgi:hypothetical protein
MKVKQDVVLDDKTARVTLERLPTVVELVCDQGLEVALRSLSLTVCTLAATCDDPADVLRKFAAYLPLDLDVVLKGSSEGDSPQDCVTLSDLTWTRQ